MNGGTKVASFLTNFEEVIKGASTLMSAIRNVFVRLGLISALAGFGAGGAHATPSYCDSVSGNLIQNCGFETGDLTDWISTPAASGSLFFVGQPGSTGNYALYFGGTDSLPDQVHQSFTVIPGHTYAIDFAFYSDGGTPNGAFIGWFDTTFHLLAGGPDQPAYNWIDAEFFFTATTPFALLVLGGFDDPGFLGFDDIVVRDANAPEPLTLSLFAAGIAGIGAIRRRKKA